MGHASVVTLQGLLALGSVAELSGILVRYKAGGLLSTDCKNQRLRDRVDYKFDYRLQKPEF